MPYVTLRVPKLTGLHKGFRSTVGRELAPVHEPHSLHRVGIADVRVGRLDNQGRPVVALRTFEYLAAVTEYVNPYTDDFGLVIAAADGGAPHVFLFDSARLRPAPLFDPDPKGPTALAHKIVTKVAGRVVPGAQLMLDRANIERVRRVFTGDPGAATRHARTTDLQEDQEITFEQVYYRGHCPTVGDDLQVTIDHEHASAAIWFEFLLQRVSEAAAALATVAPEVGIGFVDRCDQRARHLVRAALTNLRMRGDLDRDPRLVLLGFEHGPARFVRDVAEGNA